MQSCFPVSPRSIALSFRISKHSTFYTWLLYLSHGNLNTIFTSLDIQSRLLMSTVHLWIEIPGKSFFKPATINLSTLNGLENVSRYMYMYSLIESLLRSYGIQLWLKTSRFMYIYERVANVHCGSGHISTI